MGRFDNYEFRCSALGKIIGKSSITENQLNEIEVLQEKKLKKGLTAIQSEKLINLINKRDNPQMTDGIKTYLQDLFIGEIYGVRKEAFGKALDKGIFCEEDGITMLGNTLLKGQLVIKNKERRRNGFIHGECDVDKNGVVFDIKNALTLFTFGKAELSWEYEWQLVGYAWLWDSIKAVLFYCLNNMPAAMLEEEKLSLFYKNRWKFSTYESEDYIKACQGLEAAHNYDHMPIHEKFKFWEVDVSPERFKVIEKAVIEARKYLNQLWEEHQAFIERNLAAMNEPHIITATYDKDLKATIVE